MTSGTILPTFASAFKFPNASSCTVSFMRVLALVLVLVLVRDDAGTGTGTGTVAS